jgi:Protein of unknown function (DUF3631)
MNAWPSDKTCELIAKLWSAATCAINIHEGESSFAALKRLQADHGLSDVMVAYIAESHSKPADAANVLDLVLGAITSSKIIMAFEQALTVALWDLHTYVYEQFLHTPRLLVQSFEPGCGKTALAILVRALARDPFFTSSTSPAVIYHWLHKNPRATFILDEIEHSALWDRNKTLLAVFDGGHRAGGCVTRVAKNEVVEYPAFAPLLIAAVRQQPFAPQLLSRSIIIQMEERVEGLDDINPDDPCFVPVRTALLSWASTFQRPKTCDLPRELVGRSANNWRPLIEIGDTLGYPETVRAVALAMHQPAKNPVVELFWDIRRIRELPAPTGYATDELGRATGLWTEDLLTALYRLPDSHWDEFGLDEGMAPRKLGRKDLLRLLHTKHVRTRDVWKWIDGKRVSRKGFYFKDFERVWHALFVDTPTQPSKITYLPRHTKRHGGDTGDDMKKEETA